jgi:hypothetical protein
MLDQNLPTASMTNDIKNTLAVMSERVSPRAGSVSLSELRAYQSAWLDGAFACLELISRDNRNVHRTPLARTSHDNTRKDDIK